MKPLRPAWLLLLPLACAETQPPADPLPPPPPVTNPPRPDAGMPTPPEEMDPRIEAAAALGMPEPIFVPSLDYTAEEIANAIDGTAVLRGLPIELGVPFDWEQDPFNDRTYRLGLQAWWGLAPLLYGHGIDKDPRALEVAVAHAVDWLQTYRDPENDVSEWAWNSSAIAYRATYLAYMFRAAAATDTLDQETASILWDGMILHGDLLLGGTKFFETNAGTTHDSGLALLAYHLPTLPRADEYSATVTARIPPLAEKLFGPDDLTLEHTPWYHFLVLRDVERITRAAPSLSDLFRRTQAAGLWLVAPDGYLVQFGDSLLIRPQQELVAGTTPPEGLRVFTETGYAVARRGASYFAATAQFHSRAHKQPDELTFSWFERGRRIISDTGRYGYFPDDPERAFALSSRAHNSLVVDGEDFSTAIADAYGSALIGGAEAGAWSVVVGDNPPLEQNQGVRHRRWYFFSAERWLLVVDEVDGAGPRRINRYVHVGPDFTTTSLPSPRAVRADAEDMSVWIADVSNEAPSVSITRGQREPELQGFTFPGNRTFLERDTVTFEQTLAGANTFITAMRLDPSASFIASPPSITVSQTANGVTLSIDGEGSLAAELVGDNVSLRVGD